jgi:cell division protein FtsI/penicillin-binding protein 2
MAEKHRIDSWFIGFAPVENPKIAWAVIVEGGGYGAAPRRRSRAICWRQRRASDY